MIYRRYLFKNIAVSFFLILSILVTLIWFSKSVTFVKYIAENGVGIGYFFYLFALILPWLLLLIIPISLFISIILLFNRLIMRNEISVLKGCGLSKIEICKPIIFFSFLVTIFCFVTSLYLMPKANREMRIVRRDIYDNYTNINFNPKIFENIKTLTIYANDRSKEGELFGIFLHDERYVNYSLTITAKKGVIVTENNSVLLHMNEGTVQRYNHQTKGSEILKFDEYVFNLSENNKETSYGKWKPKERFFNELLNPQESLSKEESNKIRSEIQKRITYPILPISLSMIALAFMLRGAFNRKGNLNNIIFATFSGSIFLIATMTIYDLIEHNKYFIFLLYFNFIFFAMLSLRMIIVNYRKRK